MSGVATLREIRRRIRSVENTKKITRAMEMVAAAKLRRFQDFLESTRSYTERLGDLFDQLLGELPLHYSHPFLKKNESVESEAGNAPRKVALVVFTSDTGLCGTYNSELENFVKKWLKENQELKTTFIFVGKHGANALHQRREETLASLFDLRVSRVDEVVEELQKITQSAYLESGIDEVWAFYTFMENLARFRPVAEKVLPLTRKNSEAEPIRFLIEPDPKTVFDRLIPSFFEARLRFIFYHALLTEQIARMSAMRLATQNAEEMIDELTLLRNKARQASITKELIEIVSGSRAQRMK